MYVYYRIMEYRCTFIDTAQFGGLSHELCLSELLATGGRELNAVAVSHISGRRLPFTFITKRFCQKMSSQLVPFLSCPQEIWLLWKWKVDVSHISFRCLPVFIASWSTYSCPAQFVLTVDYQLSWAIKYNLGASHMDTGSGGGGELIAVEVEVSRTCGRLLLSFSSQIYFYKTWAVNLSPFILSTRELIAVEVSHIRGSCFHFPFIDKYNSQLLICPQNLV